MEKFEEKEISSKRVFDGRLLRVRVDTVRLSNGVESTREIVEHPGAVAVIAITKDNEMVLVRQFRRAAGEVLLEVPAGVPEKGGKGRGCRAARTGRGNRLSREENHQSLGGLRFARIFQ